MRGLLRTIEPPSQPIFFHEYKSHWHALKRHDDSWLTNYDYTPLFVVFDGETQRRFSSVRIVLYCEKNIPRHTRKIWVCFLPGECSEEIFTYYYTLTLHRPLDNINWSLLPTAPESIACTMCPPVILLSHSSQLHSEFPLILKSGKFILGSSLQPQVTNCAIGTARPSEFFWKANTR